jgi:hypothetical protein
VQGAAATAAYIRYEDWAFPPSEYEKGGRRWSSGAPGTAPRLPALASASQKQKTPLTAAERWRGLGRSGLRSVPGDRGREGSEEKACPFGGVGFGALSRSRSLLVGGAARRPRRGWWTGRWPRDERAGTGRCARPGRALSSGPPAADVRPLAVSVTRSDLEGSVNWATGSRSQNPASPIKMTPVLVALVSLHYQRILWTL